MMDPDLIAQVQKQLDDVRTAAVDSRDADTARTRAAYKRAMSKISARYAEARGEIRRLEKALSALSGQAPVVSVSGGTGVNMTRLGAANRDAIARMIELAGATGATTDDLRQAPDPPVSVSTLSKHLGQLRSEGLIRYEVRDRMHRYFWVGANNATEAPSAEDPVDPGTAQEITRPLQPLSRRVNREIEREKEARKPPKAADNALRPSGERLRELVLRQFQSAGLRAPKQVRDVAQVLVVPAAEVAQAVQALKADGLVERTPDGQYQLVVG